MLSGTTLQVRHNSPETTPKTTIDTQRPQVPLSKLWRNDREIETEGCGHSKERQNKRVKGRGTASVDTGLHGSAATGVCYNQRPGRYP